MKVVKLIAALLLIQVAGCVAMKTDEVYECDEGIEITSESQRDSQLYVQNKTMTPLVLRWRVKGHTDRRLDEALVPGASHLVGPISRLDYVDFKTLEQNKWNRPQDALAQAKAKAVPGGVITLNIKKVGDTYTFSSELQPVIESKGGFKQDEELSHGFALLNFFPRVKAKLVSAYGEQLKGATIADAERFIKETKSIMPADFLNISEKYTRDEVNRAYQNADDQLERAQLAPAVVSAIRGQLRYARDAALAQLR